MSAAVVFPLWYIATNAREIYTIVVLSLLGLSLLLMAALRIRWALKQSDRGVGRQLLTVLGKIAVFLFFIVSLYSILWLFTLKLYTIAGVSLFAYLLLLGLYKFGRGKKSLKFSPPGT